MGMEDYIGGSTWKSERGPDNRQFSLKVRKTELSPNKEAVTCLNIITRQTDIFEKEHKNFSL